MASTSSISEAVVVAVDAAEVGLTSGEEAVLVPSGLMAALTILAVSSLLK